MENNIIFSILFLWIGLFNLYYSYNFLKSKKFAREYIKNKSKGKIFRKLFGVEKAIKISRNILAPIGFLIGIFAIILGIIMLMDIL